MLRSLWLTCALVMASAVARAQPAQAPAGQVQAAAATDRAQATVAAAEQRVRQLAAQRGQLAQRYQQELAAIDRLKKQRSSWRQQRDLRDQLASSKDTADQLTRVTNDLTTAQRALAGSRAALVKAIDAERASGVTGPRAVLLAKLRQAAAPEAAAAAKKIVIPDAEVDPLAAPEELEQQAAAIREAEEQLARQKTGLDKQFEDLAHADELRKQHQRANDLAMRDDDQPRRSAQQSANKTAAEDQFGGPTNNPAPGTGGAGQDGGGGSPLPPGDRGPLSTGAQFESQISVTLGDVFDHSTVQSLINASRSGDPAQRADAAKRARDAVAAKLELLKKKRKLIEDRVKALRNR